MKPLPNPYGRRDMPPPECLDPFQHPLNKAIDSLLSSQPGSMNEVFKELREQGFVWEDDDERSA